MGEWIGTENPEGEARGFTEAAAMSGRGDLLVLCDIPHRDCGQYSRGRAADGAACRTWLAGVACGIGDRAATVILEPDALLPLVDGCTPEEFQEECYDLLAGAVTSLAALKNTRVQLDAGNAGRALGETPTTHGQEVVGGVVAPGPVVRLEQPEQQDERERRGRAQHERGAYPVRLLRER